MYIPQNMEMTEFETIRAFISEFGFGTLITQDLQVTRLPLVFDATEDKKGRIVGHMTRANPQWKGLSGKRVSVLFNGPHSYISPTWYVSRPAVSTWNYASVQCFGEFQELSKPDTLNAINRLIRKYDPEILNNSQLMPHEYAQQLLKAVVGFTVAVDDIQAIEKLGQHKKKEDQLAVFEALANSQDYDSIQLANYMKHRGTGNGG